MHAQLNVKNQCNQWAPIGVHPARCATTIPTHRKNRVDANEWEIIRGFWPTATTSTQTKLHSTNDLSAAYTQTDAFTRFLTLHSINPQLAIHRSGTEMVTGSSSRPPLNWTPSVQLKEVCCYQGPIVIHRLWKNASKLADFGWDEHHQSWWALLIAQEEMDTLRRVWDLTEGVVTSRKRSRLEWGGRPDGEADEGILVLAETSGTPNL